MNKANPQNRKKTMDEHQILTVEPRRFDIAGAVSTIEVEFHKDPRWAARLSAIRPILHEPMVDGLALARYASRTALTGSALPGMTILKGPGEPVLLDAADLLDLSFVVASFGRMPAEEDHSDGSRYLDLRARIEGRLGLKHIHLGLRGGERQNELETAIESVAMRLAEHSLAVSHSPELGFLKFAEMIKKGGRVFSFRAGADALLGTSALASAYQLAILSNPVIAVELAAGGAVAYMVLKFGGAVGKRVEQFIENWNAG